MKIYTLNGRRQYPNWMAGRMGAGPWIPPLVIDAINEAGTEAEPTAGGTSFDEIVATVQNVVNSLGSLFGGFVTIGPSYNPANGGEVRRQLEGTGQVNEPWANAYMTFLREYEPDLWNSGDIWDVPRGSNSHPSTFADKYRALVAAGMPNGALVDRNMAPIGLTLAVQSATQPGGLTTAGLSWLPLVAVGGLLLFTQSARK